MKDIIRLYERNDYYTGKLLSAKDFKAEQEYFNGKRSLFNIFTLGSGILYGLDVIKTGDNRQEESISIKPGIAIDSWGRELVVPEIDTKILVELEGFPEDEFNGAMYLCLEYSEKGIAEASLTDDIDETSGTRRYNRTLEEYRVVLKKKPPEGLTGIERLAYNVVPLYEDDRVILWHKSPKYMNAGEAFECSFMLIKLKKNIRVKLDYETKAADLNIFSERVSFESAERDEETEKEYTYSMEGSTKDGCIIFDDKNLELTIGDDLVPIKPATAAIRYETLPLMGKAVREYYHENLKERMELIDKDRIYLAKIFMLQVKNVLGTKYHIEHIEDTMFTRYIYPQYLQSFIFGRKKTVVAQKEAEPEEEETENGPLNESLNEPLNGPFEMVKTGTVRIPVRGSCRKAYYTNEIEHGLGIGQVLITTGIEEGDNSLTAKAGGMDKTVFSGHTGVFHKSEFAPCCSGAAIGTVLYPNKGTFRIGASFQRVDPGKEWITVRWWASRCEMPN